MRAIITRVLQCTHTLPQRIRAEAAGVKRSVSVHAIPDQYDQTAADRHAYVARILATEQGWKGEWITGEGIRPGELVHVQIPEVFVKAREAVLATRLAIVKGQNNGNPHSREYGQKVTALTDGGGPLEGEFKEYARTRPHCRYYYVRFTPTGGDPEPWKIEEFSNYHAGQFNDRLTPDGIKREHAEVLVRRWTKTGQLANGTYDYKLEWEL